MIQSIPDEQSVACDQPMKTLDQTEPVTFRLIIVRRHGSEVLFRSDESGWTLPCVKALPSERVALQLTAELRRQFGVRAYCLFIPTFLDSDNNARRLSYAVLESFTQNDSAPRGMCWVSRAALACPGTHAVEDTHAITQSLVELDLYTTDAKGGPFGRSGWFRDLFAWTQDQLSPLRLRVNGRFRQLNAGPTFSLIRLETNGPAVWFKATGNPNRHELPITLLLSRFFPANLPPLLGVNQSWNAWLSEEVSDKTLEQFPEIGIWERAAIELAELEIASIGRSSALLGGQCKDLRLPRLANLVSPFLARMAEFMAAQETRSPLPLTIRELDFIGERLEEAFAVHNDLRVPETLGHLDLNPGNILVAPSRCVFLDWAEACVASPFITFEYLAEHFRYSNIGGAEGCQRLVTAYRRPWRSFLSDGDLARAMEVSPLVAVFGFAVAGDVWRLPDTLHRASDAGFLRSLTRRMHREAVQLTERSERCPA
jgi:Phosphotransferase enzyme family